MRYRGTQLIQSGIRLLSAIGLYCTTSISAHAVSFDFSGFATIALGQTWGECKPSSFAPPLSETCTRFIGDWAQGAAYTPQLSFNPGSKLGLQGTAHFTDTLSATTQFVGRLANEQRVTLEWAYLSYQLSPAWTLYAGRKRLPIFYYSDFQDVGFAYPWIRPAASFYGYEVVNYNGFSATYRDTWGDWGIAATALAGRERNKNNPLNRLYSSTPTIVTWDKILGTTFEVNKDWFTGRVSYIQSDIKNQNQETLDYYAFPSGVTNGRQRIYGFALNADYENWIFRSELSIIDRHWVSHRVFAWYYSLGYNIGNWTPIVSYNRYSEKTDFKDSYFPAYVNIFSAALRYNLTRSSSLKVQYDKFNDKRPPATGDSNVMAIAFDTVF